MLRNVGLLSLVQTIFQSGSVHLTTSGSIIGLMLAQNESLSTWPASLAVISAVAVTLPASFVMARYGRRVGFILALCLGTAGVSLSAWGIMARSFTIFCLGALTMGGLFGFTNFLRFAAVEVVDAAHRSRALSLVLAGGVLAALLGPSMTALGYAIVPGYPFAGGYLLFVPLYAVAALLLFSIGFQPAAPRTTGAREALGYLLRNRRFLRIVFVGAGAYVTMVLLMTATPLAMHHQHLGFEATTQVIRAHVLGMFVPSFFTGHLITRFGTRALVVSGSLLFAVCIGINFNGTTYWHFMAALVLLGIGWNFLFVSASRQLTADLPAHLQAASQGLNDFIIAGSSALAISNAGSLHMSMGWQYLNLAALPLVLLLAVAGFSAADQRA